MPEPTDKAGGRTRPFADVLRELDKGRLHAELSAQLQDVIAAVVDTRKPGSVSVTLKVSPDRADGMVRVAAGRTAKVPQRDRESLFYVTDDHNLSRDNPIQPTLPLQVAGAMTPEAHSR
jgi:hypothetical protein